MTGIGKTLPFEATTITGLQVPLGVAEHLLPLAHAAAIALDLGRVLLAMVQPILQ